MVKNVLKWLVFGIALIFADVFISKAVDDNTGNHNDTYYVLSFIFNTIAVTWMISFKVSFLWKYRWYRSLFIYRAWYEIHDKRLGGYYNRKAVRWIPKSKWDEIYDPKYTTLFGVRTGRGKN